MSSRPRPAGFGALAALLLAGLGAASSAAAPCGFEHPKRATGFHAALVQAHWGCAPVVSSCCGLANTATEGGIPACEPPATFVQHGGAQSDAWRWGPQGQGRVSIAARTNTVPSYPADSADLAIRLKVTDLRTLDGHRADNEGTLGLVLRATVRDRVGGAMTIVDFPLAAPAAAANGRVNVKTTLNTLMQENPVFTSFPGCTSLEIESLVLQDPNGDIFASPGIFLPDL